MTTTSDITDKGRLLVGAGFVFGVAFTMLILAVVTSTVASRVGESFLATEVLVTIAAGVFVAAVVGVSLFLLAFPENRVRVPLELARGGSDAVTADEER
jgi:hypothetical protein